MSKYVTMKDVNSLRKSLRNSYKDIFNACDVNELTKKERFVYVKYISNEATSIYTHGGFRSLNPEEQVTYLNLKKKLDGDKLTDSNTKEALNTLRDVYKNHISRERPKWYQLTKRYALWKESSAIKEYEAMLEKKGIMPMAIQSAKADVLSNNTLNESVKPEVINKQRVEINELDNAVEAKDNSYVEPVQSKVLVSQLGC